MNGIYSWIFLWLFMENVSASGRLSLQFLEYENPTYDKEDKSCCQSSAGASSCRFHCHNSFHICVSESKGDGNSGGTCDIVKYTSNMIQRDHISFPQQPYDDRLASPFHYTFQKWNGEILFDINVIDIYGTTDDLIVDFLNTKNISAENFGHDSLKQIRLTKSKGERMKVFKLNVSVTCDQDFFAPDCNTYCAPQNDADKGHYNCSEFGEKVCLNGWENTTMNCLKKYCTPSDDDTKGHYNCSEMGDKICLDGWDDSAMDCLKKYCVPYDDNDHGHYSCSTMGDKICLDGWYDSNCTTRNFTMPIVTPVEGGESDSTKMIIIPIVAVIVSLVALALIIMLAIYCRRKRKTYPLKKEYLTLNGATSSIPPPVQTTKDYDTSAAQHRHALLIGKDEMFSDAVRYGC